MKLQTPAGQGHTKEAMWLIFTATLDKRKPVKPCASIQLGTICGLSHLPGVRTYSVHTLFNLSNEAEATVIIVQKN